jgi:hypothetical protein
MLNGNERSFLCILFPRMDEKYQFAPMPWYKLQFIALFENGGPCGPRAPMGRK